MSEETTPKTDETAPVEAQADQPAATATEESTAWKSRLRRRRRRTRSSRNADNKQIALDNAGTHSIDDAVNVENKPFFLYFASTLVHAPNAQNALEDYTSSWTPKGLFSF